MAANAVRVQTVFGLRRRTLNPKYATTTRCALLPARPAKRSGHEVVIKTVKHALAEGHYEGRMLPSYRQLARELNVTMASVWRAMGELEREGLVRREKGRGVFPLKRPRVATSAKSLPLQCINFVTFAPILPSSVKTDYLVGYTEALDHLGIRARFVAGGTMERQYDSWFLDSVPIQAQGVVLINWCAPELIEWLRQRNVPFVVQYFQQYGAEDLPAHFGVYVNKTKGAFQAVSHLLDLGHRRVGFMGHANSADPAPAMLMTFEGYRAALACAGLGFAKDNILHCDCQAGETRKMFVMAKAFLQRRRRPTAVFAMCDEYAMSLLQAAHALDLRVPEDLSIVGFDNLPASRETDPPLTTVSIPRRELAVHAVELLLEAARTPRVSSRMHILDTHLMIRETTAPPPTEHAGDSTNSPLAPF